MLRVFLASVAALGLGGHPAAACDGPGATRVDAIYPSGEIVPENLLRLYLYFSGPMADADVLPKVSLTRSDSAPVDGAFLSNRYELWSPDRTRLTLLFDPGRVKTGLRAHEAMGRALRAGERYVLTVDASAMDADGCDLAAAFSHGFVAGPSDTEPPDPGLWDIDIPQAGTTEPLRIAFGSPHDHLSMAFRIRVRHNGKPLPGRVNLQADETIWEFAPRRSWAAERHEISIEDALEDLAGNRPGRLFDQPAGLELPRPALQLWFLPTSE